MHDTALIAGESFSEIYGGPEKVVVDIGGQNVGNGSLRSFFELEGMKYICVDIVEHPSVDIVVKPGDKLPFDTGSIDLIVSSSCFEHDPCFWLTFKEMARILRVGGYAYVNAPTNGVYHCHPGDNWRFYSDAGQALAFWSGTPLSTEEVHPMKVIETFHVLPIADIWTDFVCVWQRVTERETEITVSPRVSNRIGKLRERIHSKSVKTVAKC
jgi:SAM-dependent methyltransferase